MKRGNKMKTEREIYNFTNTLQLENYVKELRIAYAKSYLGDKTDLRDLAEEDFISVYTMLQIKDNEELKERFNKILYQEH